MSRRHGGRAARPLAAITATLLLVAVAGSCSSSGSTKSSTPEATSCNATTVAEEVLPSVVTISASNGSASATGSGEVIRAEGYILTNNHVVAVAASGGSVHVLFSNGTSVAATIRGRDPQTDLAVLKVDTGKSLPAIAVGSSEAVKIGEPVVALGAPLGLSGTVTAGIVSALDRTVQIKAENGQTVTLLSAVQTDAAINPGNSGGALVECSGELIGVPTANASLPSEGGGQTSGSIGLGFAIPSDVAIAVADQLIATGKVSHSYFGIEVARVVPTTEDPEAHGVVVTGLDPHGPSAAAGLKVGDVITEADGRPVTDPNQLAMLTLQKQPGASVPVTYVRGGTSHEATIQLTAPPP
jgi:putative serine protease PepD